MLVVSEVSVGTCAESEEPNREFRETKGQDETKVDVSTTEGQKEKQRKRIQLRVGLYERGTCEGIR